MVRLLKHAAILAAGGEVPRVPWDEIKALLGL
jgi:hypothetical protein